MKWQTVWWIYKLKSINNVKIKDNKAHTWATEFSRVWVGYPQLTIYPRQLKNSGVELTIYPTTDFLTQILSLNFIIFIKNKTKYV